MRVLHLPTNIASQVSVTVRALRELGVNARGLIRDNSRLQTDNGLELHPVSSRKRHPIKGSFETMNWWRSVRAALKWADVVHWHFGDPALPADLDLRYLLKQDKARLIEFWGSDIRIPEKASADNLYMADMYKSNPALENGARGRSLSRQRKFGQYGFSAIVTGLELSDYLERENFQTTYQGKPRLLISEYAPHYPNPDNNCPVVVHAPSNKAIKGTEAVLRAVNSLKDKLAFEFRLIQNVPHKEALRIMSQADIMLDQFVIGENGLASLEAMALGKPTVCYIKPSIAARLPKDCPIINASAENLAEVLTGLIKNGQQRNKSGRAGRAYVEKHHDAIQIAGDLIKIYETELAARK